MNAYRTFAIATLALSALAAQAGENGYGEQYPVEAAQTSTLTRAAVVAELVAARQAHTLPQDGEWYHVAAPVAIAGSPLSRETVRAEMLAAKQSHSIVSGDH